MNLIGLDVGTKRIGVAKADTSTKIAIPDGFILVNGQEFAEIARAARLYNTSVFVIGLPRNNNGEETQQSAYVRNFAHQLAQTIPNARIYFQDESLTSVEAERRLKARKKNYEKGEIDSESAAIILQDCIEHFNQKTGKIENANVYQETVEPSNTTVTTEEVKPVKAPKSPKKAGHIVLFVFLGILILIAVGGILAYNWYMKSLEPVSDVSCKFETAMAAASSTEADNASECEFKKFNVNNNDSIETIAENLKEAGLIKDALAFRIYNKLEGTESQLKAGQYDFRPTMNLPTIVKQMVEGVAATNVFNFTILPGETIADIKAKLIKLGYKKDEVNAAFEKHYDHKLLNGLYSADGSLANNNQPLSVQLEGYIYGETYQFYIGEKVEKILTTTFDEMWDVIEGNDLVNKFAARGLTLREGIILASIIQKEANPNDMPGVSQVFQNRIRVGMALGSDVTASYAADLTDPNRESLTDNLSILQNDNLYNTRVHTGLTPGPISSPSVSALLAVANPDGAHAHDLYFLTGDDGVMYYSDTEAGHQQNIYDHCQEMCGVSL